MGVNSAGAIHQRDNLTGNWKRIDGDLKQIAIGPLGVFGINPSGNAFYLRGSYKNPFALGKDWQRLESANTFHSISAGLKDVVCTTASNEVFVLENIELTGNGDISFTWKKIAGSIKQISASGGNSCQFHIISTTFKISVVNHIFKNHHF